VYVLLSHVVKLVGNGDMSLMSDCVGLYVLCALH
jgi:hypothetical protein